MTPERRRVAELVAEVRARGIWLRLDGPEVLTVGPPARLDPVTLTALRAHKAELLALFAEPGPWPCVRCERFAFRLPTICYWCESAARRTIRA